MSIEDDASAAGRSPQPAARRRVADGTAAGTGAGTGAVVAGASGRGRRLMPVIWPAALFALVFLAVAVIGAVGFGPDTRAQAPDTSVPAVSPEGGRVPGNVLGADSDAAMWRALRGGVEGTVSIPDPNAAVLIQSEGENWRAFRNGPLKVYSAWALLGVVALLALFFALRGRIRIDSGPSPDRVERFKTIERFAHWLLAGSFIVLALTGLNIMYGRYFLLPVIGAEAFSLISQWGKVAHNTLAFSFMVGLAMVFVLWVRHNLPSRHDLAWLAKGGGIFVKGVHPPAKKFNAGQKGIFWMVVLGGLSLSLSGWALLFPFEYAMFAKTFMALNLLGFDLPTALTPMQEMQLSALWHAIVGIVLIVVVVAHIYIGSLGMEGAFDAMGTGQVDRNWAKEHHSLWVRDLEAGGKAAGGDD